MYAPMHFVTPFLQMHRKKRGLESAFLNTEEAERDDKKRIRRIRKSLRNKERAAMPKKDYDVASDKRVSVASRSEGRGEAYSNSSTFFSKLQEQVTDGIKTVKQKQNAGEGDGVRKHTSQGLKL